MIGSRGKGPGCSEKPSAFSFLDPCPMSPDPLFIIMSHTAIILIALGGPRSLEEVGPFMTAFMGRPAPPPVVDAVVERYKLIGGKSPLPEIVKAQAHALEKVLGDG